jgi:hypothetical protein
VLLFFFSSLLSVLEQASNGNLVKTVHTLFYTLLLFTRFSVSFLVAAFSYFWLFFVWSWGLSFTLFSGFLLFTAAPFFRQHRKAQLPIAAAFSFFFYKGSHSYSLVFFTPPFPGSFAFVSFLSSLFCLSAFIQLLFPLSATVLRSGLKKRFCSIFH